LTSDPNNKARIVLLSIGSGIIAGVSLLRSCSAVTNGSCERPCQPHFAGVIAHERTLCQQKGHRRTGTRSATNPFVFGQQANPPRSVSDGPAGPG
jgi:hypothetical protein